MMRIMHPMDLTLTAPVFSCGVQLDDSPRRLGSLRRSDDIVDQPEKLRERFLEDGYLYLPGFLNREDVLTARRSILDVIASEGALDPNHPKEEAIAKSGLEMAFRPDLANGNPAIESLLYSDRVMRLYDGVLGGPSMHYDYTWLRAVAPGKNTPPHYDIVYMGRGTKNICTAWIPLGDIPIPVGGLMILEKSHTLADVIGTYGQMDVDVVCENKPGVMAINDKGYPGYGAFSFDPVEVAERFDRRWLTNDFQAGDLLTFSMFTLHASTDNRSNQVRLSTDSRYQLAAEPADHRWIGPSPIGHGPNARKGMIC